MKKNSKTVLITGATSGIGLETALFLSEKGFTVYGTGRKQSVSPNKDIKMLVMDVRNEQQVQQAVAQVIENEGKIDVLINNAGVGISGAVEEIPSEELHNVFETNFFGALNVIKAVVPYMRQQGGGFILNITSIAGYSGLPFRGAYSASKGALEIITETLRMELKPFGIELSCLAPGDFATDIAQRRYHAPVTQGSAYEKQYEKQLRIMNAHVNSGQHPSLMAKRIYRIIKSPKKSIHYKQGTFLQRFSIVLKRILPDICYERLLMNHYQL